MATSIIEMKRSQSNPQAFGFGGLVESGEPSAARSSWRAPLLVVSLLLHAVVIAAVVGVPLLRDAELPEPAAAVNAFFVAPAPPAAPPPPAAGAHRASAAARGGGAAPRRFTAPIDIPDKLEIADALGATIEGGVEGGVAGGVVGSVVGGTLDGPPAGEPMIVGKEVRAPRKLVDVKPVYPKAAQLARVQGVVVIECLIDPRGNVVDAKTVASIPLLDEAALAAVRQWRYMPTLFGGVPVPVQMIVTVRFHVS